MEPKEQFAANLRAQRARLRLSQEDLAQASSLHRTAIGMIERCERDPQLETIVKLARALEVPPASLLAGIP